MWKEILLNKKVEVAKITLGGGKKKRENNTKIHNTVLKIHNKISKYNIIAEIPLGGGKHRDRTQKYLSTAEKHRGSTQKYSTQWENVQ